MTDLIDLLRGGYINISFVEREQIADALEAKIRAEFDASFDPDSNHRRLLQTARAMLCRL